MFHAALLSKNFSSPPRRSWQITGTADTGFNSGSGVETFSALPAASGIVIANNGDLLVAGVSSTNYVTAELNSSTGGLDTSYNSSGSNSVNISIASTLGFLNMVEAPDGELIIAGNYVPGGQCGWPDLLRRRRPGIGRRR